jgi:hypothetical protein
MLANMPRVTTRVEPELIREVAARAGLSSRASVAEVVRYALAVAAGRPDPHDVALVRPGPKRRAAIISGGVTSP